MTALRVRTALCASMANTDTTASASPATRACCARLVSTADLGVVLLTVGRSYVRDDVFR